MSHVWFRIAIHETVMLFDALAALLLSVAVGHSAR